MKKNYDQLLVDLLERHSLNQEVPKVLLHSCCAPCSSYVIECLSKYCDLTILYYNPNISPIEEYEKRKKEQKRLIEKIPKNHRIDMIDRDYDNDLYEIAIKGLENEPERGSRCSVCFKLRLEKAAMMAKEMVYDYFGTTLTVSPYKNSSIINEIGLELEEKYKISFLISDFKKRNGYKRSIELSNEYSLYRQNYCGCKYSKKEDKKGDING